jgi:hypothetical protein
VAEPEHREWMQRAIACEGEAHRAALAGDWPGAREAFAQAARDYAASWAAAPPAAYGRLVGWLKAAILAGDPQAAVAEVRAAIGEEAAASSPTAAYALALAALAAGDDEAAARHAQAMRGGSDAFDRAAAAIDALAARDRDGYARAVQAIVDDFAGRAEHLTGVAVADTAMMLEELAAARGLAARPASPLVPRRGH